MNRQLSFSTACIFEAFLLLLAVVWGRWFEASPLHDLYWDPKAAIIGAAATAPPFAFFWWTLRSQLSPLLRHRALMDDLMRPMFAHWNVAQLAFISALAGLCEEALFRGAIQGDLGARIGTAGALVLGSLAFGTAHLITWTYGILAALIGAYLGLLWIWTGNLLSPMITHALYDFCALLYFLSLAKKDRPAS